MNSLLKLGYASMASLVSNRLVVSKTFSHMLANVCFFEPSAHSVKRAIYDFYAITCAGSIELYI